MKNIFDNPINSAIEEFSNIIFKFLKKRPFTDRYASSIILNTYRKKALQYKDKNSFIQELENMATYLKAAMESSKE